MLTLKDKLAFWTGIMRDHAEFLILNLSSNEIEFVNNAKKYKEEFGELHNSITDPISEELIIKITTLLNSFIDFKCYLLQKLLTYDIELNFPPSFINHMINEALEFRKTIEEIKQKSNINATQKIINLHKIWLPDASGHASSIASSLDPVEAPYIREAKMYAKDFNDLFIKTIELGKMLDRTYLSNGELNYLNEEIIAKISSFIYFLNNIRELVSNCKILSVLKPLLPDHMIREEQYYLANIENINV